MTEPFAFRDENGDLRLDEALGERYVRHYTGILNSSSEEFRAMQLGYAALPPPEEDEPPSWRAWDAREREAPPGWRMTMEGDGPEVASSCQEMEPTPTYIWDVCGYYRRLGVPWAATNRQLREAYLTLDPQQTDERLHYALMQLLNPIIRRAYDRMPLGGLFMGDRDVQEVLRRQASMEASRRNAENDGWEPETSQGEVLKEWGLQDGLTPEEARERLRGNAGEAAPLGSEAGTLGSTLSQWDRHWSWFRMSDLGGTMDLPSPLVLQEWQAMIATACTELGVRMTFAVGIWPGHAPRSWRDSNKCCIFFIGNEHQTHELAIEAVRRVVAQWKQ